MRLKIAAASILAILGLSTAEAQTRGYRFEGETMIVKIPKPEIAILITRQNLTPKYDLQLRESFLPKVVDSVNRKPF